VNIEYSEQAIKDMLKFNEVDRTLIAKKIEYLADNFDILKTSKKVIELKGEYQKYRFVIAKRIRVIFTIKENKIVLLVLRVGKRKNIYKDL